MSQYDNSVSVIEPSPVLALNPQDLAELGSTLTASGFTALQVRALIGKIQQAAAQVALSMAPEILEQVRKVNEARLAAVYAQVRMLPSQLGYVSRDRVLEIVQTTYSTAPRS